MALDGDDQSSIVASYNCREMFTGIIATEQVRQMKRSKKAGSSRSGR